MDTPKRYHPLLVSLHWLVAILVTLNLYIGKFVFTQRDHPNLSTAIHMVAGIAILALIIVRFAVRFGSKRPAEASSGSRLFDLLAKLVHYGLYLILLVTTVLGIVFAVQSGQLQRSFLGQQREFSPPPGGIPQQGFTTPEGGFQRPEGNFQRPEGGFQRPGFGGSRPLSGVFLLRAIHGQLANVLLALVALHILAALYHQFIRRDGLIGRMWYGAR